MMYGILLIAHILLSLLLIGVILVQGGRGGMAEVLGGSGSQSLFGGGGNVTMTKVTAVGVGLFLVTSLSLAKLSSKRGLSVVERLPIALPTEGVLEEGVLPVLPSEASAADTLPVTDVAPTVSPVEPPGNVQEPSDTKEPATE